LPRRIVAAIGDTAADPIAAQEAQNTAVLFESLLRAPSNRKMARPPVIGR
jgi:hypothetical protein